MNKKTKIFIALAAFIVMVMAVSSCSNQKNTAKSRWWQAFNTRYNVYFNGAQAYIAGSLEKENGNKDNYTDILPLYTVGNKGSRDLGKGSYETAITKAEKAIKLHSIKKKPEWTKTRRKTEKDIEWLNRKEYNPFIWKAWMLMGRSQFQKGSFDEAAATFSYMSRLYRTQPAIYGKARAWLAKCYIEQDWMYDAEDVIRNMARDSIDWRAQKEWDYTYADYYLHLQDWDNAVKYLRLVIKHEGRAKQRAREYYLLGQILAAQGNKTEAYNSFRKVLHQNPPYELEFNAKISMTEVMPKGQSRQKISKLKAMARSDKNAEYLDQVYYALGNVYLAENDTLKAIEAYEKGNQKATRSGIEKGVLLLHLGDLYWQLEKYSDAKRCYGEAIGLLDKERPDYEELSYRSKVLDELCPFTDAVHLQDSLQSLAHMSETDRNAAIDRVIEALKKKEKEEKKLKQQQEAEQKMAENGGNDMNENTNKTNTTTTVNKAQSGVWYFYNPQAISQGKQAFKQQWGNRKNEDDWQRINKTVVALNDDKLSQEQQFDDNGNLLNADSLSTDSVGNGEKKDKDDPSLDPHKREYYMAQIPFTDEQMAESNKILSDGIFNSGVIFKDKLDNLPLAEKALIRLTTEFPDYEKTDEALYHLFLLRNRQDRPAEGDTYKELLKEKFPDSKWTTIVTDPYFRENALYGTHIEDSLYADTYDAFRNDQHQTIKRNAEMSDKRFPLGQHRDKFIFIAGLSRLNQGDPDSCVSAMKRVVKEYPQSEVSAIAGMIVKGVEAGRKLHGAKFDIGSFWDRRSMELNAEKVDTTAKFSAERNTDFLFVMTYNPDSLNSKVTIQNPDSPSNDSLYSHQPTAENQLLYEMAKYNFTNYLVRNFDIVIEEYDGLHQLIVSGFTSYDEAYQYTRQLFQQKQIARIAAKARNIIISKYNLDMLGKQFSYNDYDKFYQKHFAPLKISEEYLLNDPKIDPSMYDPEQKETPKKEQDDNEDDNLNAEPKTSTDIEIKDEPVQEQKTSNEVEIKDEPVQEQKTSNEVEINDEPVKTEPQTSTDIEVKEEPQQQQSSTDIEIKEEPQQQSSTDIEIKEEPQQQQTTSTEIEIKEEPKVLPQQKKQEVEKQKTNTEIFEDENSSSQPTVRQQINSEVIEIIDDSNNSSKSNNNNNKKEDQKDDDEYFDLDGF